MKGFIIEFKSNDNDSRIKLYHILFGRNVYRVYRGKKYAYYMPGMLDNTPFYKIMERRIFVTSLTNVFIEDLRILGEVSVEEVERDYPIEKLYTGEDYWHNLAQEKGLEFKKKVGTRRSRCKIETVQKATF